MDICSVVNLLPRALKGYYAQLSIPLQVMSGLSPSFGLYTDTMAGKSILIVDDSLIIAERLQAMLRGLNNIGAVESAGDYPLAVQCLQQTPFDIVSLDINLPGKSGIELLRHIKAAYAQIVVIMLTNQSSDYYRTICKRLGADYFMDKSTEFDNVPSIISSLL
jgi:CheY-like chemotaxis protein